MTANIGESTGDSTRVVVIGMGAVTPYGLGAEALWQGVASGRVMIRPVRGLPMQGYRSNLGGEVQEAVVPFHEYRRPNGHREPAMDFALWAAEEAMHAAGPATKGILPERWALVLGTCFAGIHSAERWFEERNAGRKANAAMLLLAPAHAIAEVVSAAFDIRGPVVTVDTACASGANAIGYGSDLIRNQRADMVLAGGADALCDLNFAGFSSVQALSPGPSAPFSRTRSGLNLGEGSGMLVLTSDTIARQLGATVLAEVAGYGLSADGFHPTAPDPQGDGAAQAIGQALEHAGLEPHQVTYVNTHGTGTPKNDVAETRAIRRAFGETADNLAVSSTKSMIGHLTGAAGAVEGIVTVQALQAQIAPPTANFLEADPACDLDNVPNEARPHLMDAAISNNFGFGGANACVVFGRAGARGTHPPTVQRDRVVVTGLATIVPPGLDIDEAWQAFNEGWEVTHREDGVRIGRVLLGSKPFLSRRQLFRMDAFSLFAVFAAQAAVSDAGLLVSGTAGRRIGTIFGTAIGPMQSIEEFLRSLRTDGPEAANPTLFPNVVFNGAAGYVSMHLGSKGPTSTLSVGHAASAAALCYGYDLVASDRCDAAICVTADVLTNTVIRAYREVGLLRTGDHALGLSEAGVALVVERLSHARARGAHIYGEIVGYGMTSDATGPGRFDRHGRGLERAMWLAMESAHGAEVSSIWLNAAGYAPADRAEALAIRRLLPNGPSVYAPKRIFGEPLGVGGMLNAALALKHLDVGVREIGSSESTLINSSAMGGTHVSIALRPTP